VTFLATRALGKEPDGGYKYHNEQQNHDKAANPPALVGRSPGLDVNNLAWQVPKPLAAKDG
jgi:hypothetical protein